MKTCNEDTAKFMGKSLLKHAREIHRYALTYCEMTVDNQYIDDKRRAKFVGSLENMIEEMYNLMLMAETKGVSRFCNNEQIEAYMEAAAEIIEPAGTHLDLGALLN